MFKIAGVIQPGIGKATEYLATQLPLIAKTFPEVANCFHGTVNLKLDSRVLVPFPDHRTPLIDWHPEKTPGEVFDFLRILWEAPAGASPTPAWLYIAHLSPWRADLAVHEVLAPNKIEAIFDSAAPNPRSRAGMRCVLHIPRPVIHLPYLVEPIYVVMPKEGGVRSRLAKAPAK